MAAAAVACPPPVGMPAGNGAAAAAAAATTAADVAAKAKLMQQQQRPRAADQQRNQQQQQIQKQQQQQKAAAAAPAMPSPPPALAPSASAAAAAAAAASADLAALLAAHPPPASAFAGSCVLVRAPEPRTLLAPAADAQGSLPVAGGMTAETEFETDLFAGRVRLIFKTPDHSDEVAALLAGKKRQLWLCVQGTLKRAVSLDDLEYGSFYTRALRLPAPAVLGPAVRFLAARLGGALQLRISGDAPRVAGPLAAAVQMLNVSPAGAPPPDLIGAQEDTRLLFAPGDPLRDAAAPLPAARRRAFFRSAANRAGRAFEPGTVITFHTYDHAVSFADCRMAVPPCFSVDVVRVLDAQPIDLAVRDRASGEWAARFQVWHRRMLPAAHARLLALQRARRRAQRGGGGSGGGGAGGGMHLRGSSMDSDVRASDDRCAAAGGGGADGAAAAALGSGSFDSDLSGVGGGGRASALCGLETSMADVAALAAAGVAAHAIDVASDYGGDDDDGGATDGRAGGGAGGSGAGAGAGAVDDAGACIVHGVGDGGSSSGDDACALGEPAAAAAGGGGFGGAAKRARRWAKRVRHQVLASESKVLKALISAVRRRRS